MIADLAVGAARTLSLAVIAWLVGLPLGITLSFVATRGGERSMALKGGAVFVSVVPFLATLFWLHYPLQVLLGVVWPPYFTAAALLAVFVSLSVGDVVADEMHRVRARLLESALVLGLPATAFMKRVAFPASLQASVPRLLTVGIASIHMTMFASLIGVEELFRVSQRINAHVLRPVEVFTVMALVYAGLCLPLYAVAAAVQKRASRFDAGA